MFSRKEREFLELLAREGPGATSEAPALVRAFPNPVYRRKLLWGIRKKVDAAMGDLELFADAAEADRKVLPDRVELPSGVPPLYADPLVLLLRRAKAKLRARPAGPSARGRRGPGSGRRGGR